MIIYEIRPNQRLLSQESSVYKPELTIDASSELLVNLKASSIKFSNELSLAIPFFWRNRW